MGLNIKNDDVESDIRKLAELTGESLTTAIQVAVKERITRVRETPPAGDTLEQHLEAARRAGDALKRKRISGRRMRTARELIDELYDERGLPK
jgi:antitoxin VapB